MKKISLVCSILLLLSCGSDQPTVTHAESSYSIIPQPATLLPGSGFFAVDHNTIVVGSSPLKAETELLTQMLDKASGFSIAHKIGKVKETRNKIILSLDETITQPEGYVLNVSTNEVEITAKNPAGILYGIQSLRQLLPAESEIKAVKKLQIPAVLIKDHPRYAYRGMHLDVSRHFFPVAFIKKYIDLLALHKMNRFHWHLTDDQG